MKIELKIFQSLFLSLMLNVTWNLKSITFSIFLSAFQTCLHVRNLKTFQSVCIWTFQLLLRFELQNHKKFTEKLPKTWWNIPKKVISSEIHFLFARNSICSNRFPTPFMFFFTLEKFRFLVSPLCVFILFLLCFFCQTNYWNKFKKEFVFPLSQHYLSLSGIGVTKHENCHSSDVCSFSSSLSISISVPLNIIFASQYSHNRGQEISAFTIVSCHNTCRCWNSQCWSWQH